MLTVKISWEKEKKKMVQLHQPVVSVLFYTWILSDLKIHIRTWTASSSCLVLLGEEWPWLHLCVGFRKWWAQQRPLLLWWLHQLHLHNLHLQHSRERTQTVVPGGMLVHTDHHLQQRGELWQKDCKDCVWVCLSCIVYKHTLKKKSQVPMAKCFTAFFKTRMLMPSSLKSKSYLGFCSLQKFVFLFYTYCDIS